MAYKWIVVGLTGVTCGGKSSIGQKLIEKFPGSIIICQDDFFRSEDDPNHEWIDVNENVKHQNWESMSSINWVDFEKCIKDTLNKEPPNDSALLIIEGHIILNYEPIAQICDIKFFFTLTKEKCWGRRSIREYIPNDPPGYFDKWIWPMYLQYKNQVQHTQTHVVFTDGNASQDNIFKIIVNEIFLLQK